VTWIQLVAHVSQQQQQQQKQTQKEHEITSSYVPICGRRQLHYVSQRQQQQQKEHEITSSYVPICGRRRGRGGGAAHCQLDGAAVDAGDGDDDGKALFIRFLAARTRL
jgi:hypothetical protein